MTIGDRIKRAWEGAGFKNQRQAAMALGWSAQRLSHYVNNKRAPDLAALQHLAVTFQTTPGELLGGGTDDQSLRDTLLKLFQLMGRTSDQAHTLANIVLESLRLHAAYRQEGGEPMPVQAIVELLFRQSRLHQ